MTKFSFKTPKVYTQHDPFDEDVSYKNYTMLMVAIEKHLEAAGRLIKEYVRRGVDLERCNSQGVNAVFVALIHQNYHAVRELVEVNGCDVQRVLPCGKSPLQAYAEITSINQSYFSRDILRTVGFKIGFLEVWHAIRRNKFLVATFYKIPRLPSYNFEKVDIPRNDAYNWVLDGVIVDGRVQRPEGDTDTAIDEKFFMKEYQLHQESERQQQESERRSRERREQELNERREQIRALAPYDYSTLMNQVNNLIEGIHALRTTNHPNITPTPATIVSQIHHPPKKYLPTLPREFVCSVCLEPFNNPVTTTAGNVYCKECIESSIAKGNLRDPLTNTPITRSLCPASLVYRMMNEYEEK